MESVMETKERARMMLQWDTNTALAVILLTSLVAIAALRGSLSSGGAIQP